MSELAIQAGWQPHADIGILTVIPAELDAALKVLDLKRCPKDEDSGTIYWEGSAHSELTGQDYRVVFSCIGEAGNPSAAAAATEVQASPAAGGHRRGNQNQTT